MNCDIEELMEAIRDLSEASERRGGYDIGALRCPEQKQHAEQANEDMKTAWALIETITGGKRP